MYSAETAKFNERKTSHYNIFGQGRAIETIFSNEREKVLCTLYEHCLNM